MIQRFLAPLCAAVLLIACATKYQSSGFSGGFSEGRIDTNAFRISFRGNGYTRAEDVEEMALLRSAEVALDAGFSHFAIINGNVRQNPDFNGGWTAVKPGAVNTIICFHGKPDNASGFVYDAAFIAKSLGEKYR